MTLIVFLLTAVIGGTGSPLVKFTVSELSPLPLVLFRSLVSAVLILPLINYQKLALVKPKRNLLLANFLFAANWLFFAIGIQYTSVLMGQVIYLPTAAIVAALGFLFLGEKLRRLQIYGLLATLLGMAILLYGSVKTEDILSLGTPRGNLLVIAGLLSWSLYVVVSRKISHTYRPALITFFNFIASAILASIIFLWQLASESPQMSFSQNGLLGLALLSLTSVMFFVLFQWLIKHTSAFTASLVLYPITILSGASGVIFFEEKITGYFIIGAALVMFGVFLATSHARLKNYLKISI